MKTNKDLIWILGGVLSLAACSAALQAAERGVTPGGIAYVSGGVAEVEEEDLVAQRKNFSFWLTTASKGSGAFLADVRVRIVDERTRQVVLEHTLDGPWLFANLPSGRYRVEATYREFADSKEQTLRRSTTVQKGSLRQMLLYFDTSDRVKHEVEGQPKVSPYALP
ncbi:hypothetical protein [Rhodoferax sp.]|uniref:hypothetical protein n=1 Tax=Rhodoferax sp. TaxID=50421 RepID=UPI002778228C|nr:hypothetical protein [Rhodoferax sp.]